MANAASKASLQELHGLLAGAFADILKNGVKAVDKDGNPVTTTAPASYLNVIRQFVKDNDIQAPALPGSPLGDVVTNLPYAGTEDGDMRH